MYDGKSKAVAFARAGIVGTALGGGIIDSYGVTTLTTAIGLLIAVLTAVFLAGCLLGQRVWKLPYKTNT